MLAFFSYIVPKIDSYTTGLDFTSFKEKIIVQDAVLRNLQVLAESTQRLSDEFKLRHPDIEWYKIAGLRNILVHDYLVIDLETLWVTVSRKLQELKTVVRTALG